MTHVFVLLLAVGLLVGCASTPPLVVSGEALKAVGTQFVTVSTAVTNACIAKTLTAAQCAQYRIFARKFKAAWEPAVSVQQAAMVYGDPAMAQQAHAIVVRLSAELATFAALLQGGK